jgi:hypothetical protein
MKRSSLSSLAAVVVAVACAACSSPGGGSPGTSSQAISCCKESPRDFGADPAKDLIQALMFAHVAPASHVENGGGYTDTYQVAALSCQDAHAFDDGITRYDCQSPKIDDDATAMVLFDAIYGLKIYGDAGLGHTFADVSAVTCKLEVPAADPVKYSCNVTGTWADECQ